MNSFDISKRSFRNLDQARLRTFLTSCAIGIGAFALAMTLSLGTSLNNLSEKLLFSGQDNTTLSVTAPIPDGPFSGSGDEPQEYKETDPTKASQNTFFPPLTSKKLDLLGSVEGVKSVERPYDLGIKALYISNSSSKKYQVSAFDLAEPRPGLTKGTLDNLRGNEIVISEQFVSVLGFLNDDEVLGKPISFAYADSKDNILNKEYVVRGVAAKPTGLFSFFGTDAVYFSDSEIRALYEISNQGSSEFGTFFQVNILADKNAGPEDISNLRDRINAIDNGNTFNATTLADSAKDQAGFVRNIQFALAGFASVVLLASLFGIVNTQLMSVFQRTREIGLMKALGMSRWGITQLFLFEAMFIGLLGSLLGIGLAYLAARLLDPWIVKQLSNVGVSGRFLIFDPIQLLVLCIGLMIIAAFAGIIPARKAAKLDPIEALRVE